MPVFLLYAGIIHAIGLALFLPVLITLPGPAREVRPAPAPKSSAIDVVILPAAEPLTDIGPEQTSALPAAPSVEEPNAEGAAAPVAAKPDLGQEPKDARARDDVKVVAPAAEPEAKPAPLEAEPRRESREAETLSGDGAEASHEKTEAVAHVGPETEAQQSRCRSRRKRPRLGLLPPLQRPTSRPSKSPKRKKRLPTRRARKRKIPDQRPRRARQRSRALGAARQSARPDARQAAPSRVRRNLLLQWGAERDVQSPGR